MTEIAAVYMDLLRKKTPLAHLATVMPDGSITPFSVQGTS